MSHDNVAPSTAGQMARELFLRKDHMYGCAETTYVALKQVYDLPNPTQSATAMALNGGIAYSGSTCGAVTGAAMAVGELAESRLTDHKTAKTVSRRIMMRVMAGFRERFSALTCLDLIGLDISQQADHDTFIASGVWQTTCMAQIEYMVEELQELADEIIWNEWVDAALE